MRTTAGNTITQEDDTYDATGKLVTWQQQNDSSTPVVWTEGYDAADSPRR